MKRTALLFVFCIYNMLCQAKQTPISLAGKWRFEFGDTIRNAYARTLTGSINLPGTMDDAGLGPKNTDKPTLEGPYRKFNYAGPAYYQRDIEIPESWAGQRVSLFLERCRWTTKVWLDDKYIGTQESLIAPHNYYLGVNLTPGKHRLTICVDNTVKLNLGRFVSALFGGTWGNMNGIIGLVELRVTPPVWIDDVKIYPNIAKKTALVKVSIGNVTGKAGSGKVIINGKPIITNWDTTGGIAEAEADMSDAKLWDEFNPNLSQLIVKLGDDEKTIKFGMREFAAKGTQFTLNGRRVFLRGTLESSVWPQTGYPPTDVAAWQKIYRTVKSYGLNFIRFHSWTPPEAAFAAADIEGIMIQTEAPQANVDAGLDTTRDKFIEAELKRIVNTYGNHPSFCLMTIGNEYGGKDEVLTHWVDLLIKNDPRHLYSSAANAQKTQNRQFLVSNAGRGIYGPGTSRDLRAIVPKETSPILGHEIGQWITFPDFNEEKKWKGVMELKNFEIVKEDLLKKHLIDLAPRYVQSAGKFATQLYKEEIEALLRTPGYGGFELLDLHDYPTQGTALIGMLDAFWDTKGFITPENFRGYCSATVPLLRMSKRTYYLQESFKASVDVAHYGPANLVNEKMQWRIADNKGRLIDAGRFNSGTLAAGQLNTVGSINASFLKAHAPCKLTVTVSLTGDVKNSNSWDIWVYPPEEANKPNDEIAVCQRWDEAKKMLAKGKKVVFFADKTYSANSMTGRFLPVFWSPIWFPTQKPNTMGLLCNPDDPFFANFPTDSYSNWQWYNLMENSRFFNLDETPASYRPLVQVIDNFERNHKLGVVFEARVGNGKLLVCGFNPSTGIDDAACKQFIANLRGYAASKNFDPKQELDDFTLNKLFFSTFASIDADSFDAPGKRLTFGPENAVDSDPNTCWQSAAKGPNSNYPHQLVLELNAPALVNGINCLPAKDPEYSSEKASWIKDYAVYVSDNGKDWGEAIATGTFVFDNRRKNIMFPKTQKTRFIKFVALSGYNEKDPKASLAEIEVIKAE